MKHYVSEAGYSSFFRQGNTYRGGPLNGAVLSH